MFIIDLFLGRCISYCWPSGRANWLGTGEEKEAKADSNAAAEWCNTSITDVIFLEKISCWHEQSRSCSCWWNRQHIGSYLKDSFLPCTVQGSWICHLPFLISEIVKNWCLKLIWNTPVGFDPSNLVITDPNKLDFDIDALKFLTSIIMEAPAWPVLLSASTEVAAGNQQFDIRGP